MNAKRYAALIGLCLALVAPTVANADSGIRRVPCGYWQATVTSLTVVSVPAACGTNPALAVIKSEAQAIRYRDDGVAPTATVGQPIAVADAPIQYEGTISALQFIAQVSGGIVDILFYK